MFKIKAQSRQPVIDWYINVNGHKCKCDKTISANISPIINRFLSKPKNKDFMFKTELLYNQLNSDISDSSKDSANSTNLLYKLISKVFCGKKISCKEDNVEILLLIGKHFKIQEIISTIDEYHKYVEMVSLYLNDSDFKAMINLEKILLCEIDEENIDFKIKEYEQLIKKIPINCLIHFVIIICIKNINTKKINPNEHVIKLIKSINSIVPETLSIFASIIWDKLTKIHSSDIPKTEQINKKEILSIIHQMYVDDLMGYFYEYKKFEISSTMVPYCFNYYIDEHGDFKKPIKENINLNNDKKMYFNSFLDSVKKDDIESFQAFLINSQLDIERTIRIEVAAFDPFYSEYEIYSLIEYSAFSGSSKCFMYLYNNQAKINKKSLSHFAIAGGNPEIIHICEREECVFDEKSLSISIEYHRHQITKWLVETKNIAIDERNLRTCILYYNIKTLKYILKKRINMNKMMIYICESNNIILLKWFTFLLKKCNMKVSYSKKDRTALHVACEQKNIEIVKLLLSNDDIDINSVYEVIIAKLKYLLCNKLNFIKYCNIFHDAIIRISFGHKSY